jgi:hypothetical protein
MSSFTGQQKTVCFEFKGCRHFTVSKVLSKTSSTCPGYHPSKKVGEQKKEKALMNLIIQNHVNENVLKV